jgi:hypothetical protein
MLVDPLRLMDRPLSLSVFFYLFGRLLVDSPALSFILRLVVVSFVFYINISARNHVSKSKTHQIS